MQYMTSRTLSSAAAAFTAIILLGCQASKECLPDVHVNMEQRLDAEFRAGTESIVLAVDDPARIQEIETWLARIIRNQPEPEQVGNVLPWCVLSFSQKSPRGGRLIWEVPLYAHRDSRDRRELVTAADERELLILLDAEVFAGKFSRSPTKCNGRITADRGVVEARPPT